VRHRVGSMERHLANLQSDIANVHLRLDHQGDRLDRIERRLELVDSQGRRLHRAAAYSVCGSRSGTNPRVRRA